MRNNKTFVVEAEPEDIVLNHIDQTLRTMLKEIPFKDIVQRLVFVGVQDYLAPCMKFPSSMLVNIEEMKNAESTLVFGYANSNYDKLLKEATTDMAEELSI